MYVGQVMILLRSVSFKFFSYSARAYVLSKITGRQKGELPWDFHWENKTYKSKWFIEPYVKNDLDGEKKQILCILDKSLCFGFEVRFVTCLTKCLRFPLVVSVLLRSFFSNAFFAITDVCTQVNREFKITTTATTTKTSLKKWISVLLISIPTHYFFKYKRTFCEPNS